ncbi:MAG: hypothetical protein IJS78_02360 [Clostridia bacterium]|nr:hypothetical protein [Clostridia bacterium]
MDIIGKWVVSQAMQMGDDGFVWRKKDEIRDVDPEDVEEMFSGVMFFEPDGRVVTAMKIPEGVSKEELDAAVEAGEVKLCGDGYMALEETEWREEDGKILYKTSMKGEILGEEVDPWQPLKETEDGFELMFSRYTKA